MYAARIVYHFSVAIVLLSIIQVPYFADIIAHERMNIYAYASILDVSLKLLIVYLLSSGNFDKLILYAVLIFFVSVLNSLIYCYYSYRNFKECKFKITGDKTLIKPILSFSGWSLMGCGAVIGSTQGINILLNMFFGPVVNAARGISVQVSSAVAGFVVNFQTAVNPQIIKLYAAEKREELMALLFQNSKFSFCLIWLISLPVFLKIETVLNLWLTEVPEHTPLFCRLILLQSLIYCTQRPFVMACHAIGKMKTFQLLTTPPLLLVLPVSYFFLKFGFPAYFPFIVYIIMTVVEYIIELVLLRGWIELSYLKYFNKVLVPVFIVILTSFLLPFISSQLLNDSYLSFFLICIISILNATVSIYFFAFNKYSRRKILKLMLNKILKI
jgi:O-antigen/teichoic acid export membrane protein